MSTSQIATAKAIADQWPLLSEVNLIAMIASTLNVSFEQAKTLLAKTSA